jgi:hypothetical protein
VPVASDNDAATISVACMITNRLHALLVTCFVDFIASHVTLHLYSFHLVPIEYNGCPALGFIFCMLTSVFNTKSVAIAIPVASIPPMRPAGVHERAMTMTPSVKESPCNLFD